MNNLNRRSRLEVSVLRIGHRFVRDDRVTTHVALVARALGCDRIFMNEVDKSIRLMMDEIIERWGGRHFNIEIIESWKSMIKQWKSKGGKIVHLTMYGLNIDEVIEDIRKCDKLLVAVGASKVPRELYQVSDFNVSIGNQPHSEIAALAICLDRIFSGRELTKQFGDAKLRIIPSPNEKKVLNNSRN
ncbi:MAG TPA: tRNA (cytidine(56)-2'-O)-methyltransferase [Nitrososphaeraceae archaeon]|nr:tRNA (cytidine(56)-2'-O)-methyltransferase [Nitrososphaeraceae archaeon]